VTLDDLGIGVVVDDLQVFQAAVVAQNQRSHAVLAGAFGSS
jgi:hypothetical protein